MSTPADKPPSFVTAANAPLRSIKSIYPEPFARRVQGREKRPLGSLFGLKHFGVNLTRLKPGAMTALRHAHTVQDEFVYVLHGHPTLITDDGEFLLSPGDCAGFKGGTGNAHHLLNRSDSDVELLEMGDRGAGDSATYPDDDLVLQTDDKGHYKFLHKDGKPYG
jgi:uncharacterized cupin superfamily protein